MMARAWDFGLLVGHGTIASITHWKTMGGFAVPKAAKSLMWKGRDDPLRGATSLQRQRLLPQLLNQDGSWMPAHHDFILI
jgi:hypothetical protein